ncbi:hypothetical protein WN944_005721 [Citrus x changshan-huyou]|uniref:Uncharacterized protein n=1 Tax=Citrus x changshan-huyou TaxID=2935761 RepID=A0AAP0QSH0_9ROSI
MSIKHSANLCLLTREVGSRLLLDISDDFELSSLPAGNVLPSHSDDLDLEVAFVISDEEAIFKALSKIVEFTRRDYCPDWSKLLWLSFS